MCFAMTSEPESRHASHWNGLSIRRTRSALEPSSDPSARGSRSPPDGRANCFDRSDSCQRRGSIRLATNSPLTTIIKWIASER